MKSPTAGSPVGGFRWSQTDPDGFSEASVLAALAGVNLTAAEATANPAMHVGVTFQFELLDCFLSPHTCNTTQTLRGITTLLDSACKGVGVPVALTLDPVQFYYASGLWNWFDPSQPGYDPKNTANVEWTGWSADNATLIAWRDWGSQFRMPTPQPNLASPALLAKIRTAVADIVTGIRAWYEAQTPEVQALLVAVKIGEEVDVGANFYMYPGGNALWKQPAAKDPTYGPNWSKGLFGDLAPMGYNMLKTMGVRSSGGPPTRAEITAGVQAYFKNALDAAVHAWPLLGEREMLFAHGGHVEDPLLIEWDSPMVSPAVPVYSFYFGANGLPGQPGLGSSLATYDPTLKRFAAGEFFCEGCTTASEWLGALTRMFGTPYGKTRYASVYNLDAMVKIPGAISALHQFIAAL